MKVHRNPDQLPSFRKAVITAGTFDGVHMGHQKLIEEIRQISRDVSGESVLITFDPHPRAVVFPEDNSLRILTTTEEKIKLLEQLGVDHLVIVPFTREFSMMNGREYVQNFLVSKFHPAVVVIGYNHQFGHHRDGNIELLKKLAEEFSFHVKEIPKQIVDEIEVSSTRIRIALQEGDVRTAAHLLGHPYYLTGGVVKGNQLGRKLGYPTANMGVSDSAKLIPADGVYAIRIDIPEFSFHGNGIMSIGFRPTVNGTHRTIEAYIFDFDKDVYGTEIIVGFVEWIRKEIKFETIDLMLKEIKNDEQKARVILNVAT